MPRAVRKSALSPYEDEVREAWLTGTGPSKILEDLRTSYPQDEKLIPLKPGAVTTFARRAGWGERPRHPLMPWKVKREHLGNYHARMLRLLIRRQEGRALSDEESKRLGSWLRKLEQAGEVVHYDLDYAWGFKLVPRREGVDEGYVREPDK